MLRAVLCLCVSPFIHSHSHSHSHSHFHFHSHCHSRSPFPFLFNLNRVCFVQEPPPAVGQAPDLMTNPQMAALVAPIDAAVLFPFYSEVNVNNAKFRWYKTGQLDTNSRSFYAVPVACSLFSVLCSLFCSLFFCLCLFCL